MISADSNANKLLVALNDVPAWKDDMPRLVRGALGRMQRGRWNTTVANAWGVVALGKFSARFESTPVTGTTTATLGGRHVHARVETGRRRRRRSRRSSRGPTRARTSTLAQDGTGAPWVTLQSLAAIPLKEPLSSGYRITRTVTPVQQADGGPVAARRHRARHARQSRRSRT